MPNINRVKLSGSGEVIVNDFSNQSSLDIDLNGSGLFVLNGFEGITALNTSISGSGTFKSNADISTLESQSIAISGNGIYNGFTLSSNMCTANISGSGDISVTVNTNLDATISGSGDVFYKGNPMITQNILGSGNVIDAN